MLTMHTTRSEPVELPEQYAGVCCEYLLTAWLAVRVYMQRMWGVQIPEATVDVLMYSPLAEVVARIANIAAGDTEPGKERAIEAIAGIELLESSSIGLTKDFNEVVAQARVKCFESLAMAVVAANGGAAEAQRFLQ